MHSRRFSWALGALALVASLPAMAQDISTVAGNGLSLPPSDGSVATAAPLWGPTTVAAIPGGGFYIGDAGGLRKVDADGRIFTLAQAWNQVDGLVLAPSGALYFSDSGANVVKKLEGGVFSVVAGGGSGGDGGKATGARLIYPAALQFDAAGNLYISEIFGCRIRKVDNAGVISTFAGTGTCASAPDGKASVSTLNQPWGLRFDGKGNLIVVEYGANRLRRIAVDGNMTTLAGTGVAGSTGDGGPATAATFNAPVNVDIDAVGNIYVAEFSGQRIRRISTQGTITTVAGTGVAGSSGDGGLATDATLQSPYGAFIAPGGYFIPTRDGVRVRFVADAGIQPQPPLQPSTTCASEGYTGTKLVWCRNICEMGYTGATLEIWLRRWISKYRDLPYCAVD